MVVIALLIVTACTRKQESETLVAPLPAPVMPAETLVVPPPAPAVPDVDDIHFSIEDASNYFNVIFGNLSFKLPYGYDFAYYNVIDDVYDDVIKDNNNIILQITMADRYILFDEPGFFSKSRIRELAEYIAGRRRRLSYSGGNIYRLKSFNNINAVDMLTLSELSSDDIQFTRRIIFFDDKYCYFAIFRMNGIKEEKKIFPRELPEYFLVDESGGYYWNDEALEEINYKFSNNEVLPGYLQELMEKGDIIFQTMYLK
jgi:hypothetical protein